MSYRQNSTRKFLAAFREASLIAMGKDNSLVAQNELVQELVEAILNREFDSELLSLDSEYLQKVVKDFGSFGPNKTEETNHENK